jgi:hypothetical protein
MTRGYLQACARGTCVDLSGHPASTGAPGTPVRSLAGPCGSELPAPAPIPHGARKPAWIGGVASNLAGQERHHVAKAMNRRQPLWIEELPIVLVEPDGEDAEAAWCDDVLFKRIADHRQFAGGGYKS